MNFGLGTRRLAGAATQQLANGGASVLLVDEVEYGLEPHRLVHLLTYLRNKDAFSQVFVTTHSPTALQHLDPEDLVMVRSTSGATDVRSLGDPLSLRAVIKSSPEAFLSRRVVVNEGKTEYGMVLHFTDTWNTDTSEGFVSSAALGVVAIEGDGGTGSVKWATELLEVEYDVVLFVDSDDANTNALLPGVEAKGGVVVRCDVLRRCRSPLRFDDRTAAGHAVESTCRVLTEHGCGVAARTYRSCRQATRPIATRTMSDADPIDALIGVQGTHEGL